MMAFSVHIAIGRRLVRLAQGSDQPRCLLGRPSRRHRRGRLLGHLCPLKPSGSSPRGRQWLTRAEPVRAILRRWGTNTYLLSAFRYHISIKWFRSHAATQPTEVRAVRKSRRRLSYARRRQHVHATGPRRPRWHERAKVWREVANPARRLWILTRQGDSAERT
jgi:hypothetical protein